MITPNAMFRLGYIFYAYYEASNDYYQYFGESPTGEEVAIHVARHPLSDGSIRVEIAVKFRPHKPAPSWYNLDTLPENEVDSYINECRGIIDKQAGSNKPPVIEIEIPINEWR